MGIDGRKSVHFGRIGGGDLEVQSLRFGHRVGDGSAVGLLGRDVEGHLLRRQVDRKHHHVRRDDLSGGDRSVRESERQAARGGSPAFGGGRCGRQVDDALVIENVPFGGHRQKTYRGGFGQRELEAHLDGQVAELQLGFAFGERDGFRRHIGVTAQMRLGVGPEAVLHLSVEADLGGGRYDCDRVGYVGGEDEEPVARFVADFTGETTLGRAGAGGQGELRRSGRRGVENAD